MAETFIYPRPNSAQGFYSANDVFRVMPTQIVQSTTPAAAAALPNPGSIQEFTSADRYAVDCVCGGTIKAIGDSFGWLMKDEKVSTAAAYALNGEVRCLLDGAATATVGADAYIITASMLVTETSGVGAEYIGKFSSVNLTNPTGLPAGTYADVILMQSEI
jgi:hypothetical protein